MPAVWIHSQPTILRSTSVSKSNPSIIDGVDVSFSLGNRTLLNVNSTLVGCFKIWRSWLTSVEVVVVAAVSILHITHTYTINRKTDEGGASLNLTTTTDIDCYLLLVITLNYKCEKSKTHPREQRFGDTIETKKNVINVHL